MPGFGRRIPVDLDEVGAVVCERVYRGPSFGRGAYDDRV